PSQCQKIPIYYDDDNDEESYIHLRDIIISELPPCIAITPVLLTKEPDNSLSMGDEHLRTISETKSDELIKSSVENLVLIPSESGDLSDIERECDVPVCDNFTTFSNTLFDDDDFSSSDDESFSDEDVSKEIYSNPLFDEEIISTKIDLHQFNAYNDSPSLPENESFYFDIPSSPRPPAKPPDDGIYLEPDTGLLTTKVVGDISEHYVLMPRLLPTQTTLASNEEKSPHFLSHRGFKAFQLFSESPMMIYGGNIPILDVLFLHFYPP
ncbi:hypothetical protein Tco_1300123, partial [Tanacetum coccineum]